MSETNYRLLNKILCKLSNHGVSGANVVEIIPVSMIDDVNGDGTVYVPYIQYYSINEDGTIDAVASIAADYSGVYTPANPVHHSNIGSIAKNKAGKIILSAGETWTPPYLTTSFSYRVEGAGGSSTEDVYTNGGTFEDSEGNVTPIADGESSSWGWDSAESDELPVITAGTKKIIITYTYKG